MTSDIICWKCGAPLDALTLPLSRYDNCRSCNAELHVCRMCRHYDLRWRSGCREDRAQEVRERDRANFCDYFQPQPNAWQPPHLGKGKAAHADLESLFGNNSGADAAQSDESQQALEQLFRKDSDA